jgi:hypothetical protein
MDAAERVALTCCARSYQRVAAAALDLAARREDLGVFVTVAHRKHLKQDKVLVKPT